MASIRWKNSTGGTWSVGSNWSGGVVPGAGDSVLIAKAPSAGAYTIDIVSPVDVASVTLNQALATLDVLDTSLTTSLSLKAGTLELGQYDPSIAKQSASSFSGTVSQGAGTLLIGQNGGTLSAVTWEGVLAPVFDLSGSSIGTIDVTHGITLTGSNGHGPGSLVLGLGATMAFTDRKTLDHATVTLDGAYPHGGGVLTTERSGTDAATLTLGSHLTLDVTIEGSLLTTDTIVNKGDIMVTGALQVSSGPYPGSAQGTFDNVGTMQIEGGVATIDIATFTNSGTILVQDNGMLAIRREVAGSPINAGVLMIESGALALGTYYIPGKALDLVQTTILLGTASSSATLDIGHNTFLYHSVQVIEEGLDATITEQDDSNLTNSGTISGSIAGGTLLFENTDEYGDFNLVNNGTISVSNGETLAFGSDCGYSGSGSILLTNSTLEIANLDPSEFAMIHSTGSVIHVEDNLDLGGVTLTVGDGPTDTTIELGAPLPGAGTAILNGGTLFDTGGGLRLSGNVMLENLAYRGTLTVGTPYTTVSLNNTTFVNFQGYGPGTIYLTGAQALVVEASNGGTLDAVFVDIGNVGLADGAEDAPRLMFGNNGTLGAQSTVVQIATYAAIGAGSGPGNIVDAITGQGTIEASTQAGQFTIDGLAFTNAGTIAISNGDTFVSASATFVNTGQITLASGTIDLALANYFQSFSIAPQSFSNYGSIALAGGTVTELTYGGTYPDVPMLNGVGGVISGYGTFSTDIVNQGNIEATSGTLSIGGVVSGSGDVLVDAGATLSLVQVMAGQTASFSGTGGILSLTPMSFLGSIAGFAPGDTIDLRATNAVSAQFSGAAILVTLANGRTEMLQTVSALTGALAVTHVPGTDSLITFASAVPGDVPGVTTFLALPTHH